MDLERMNSVIDAHAEILKGICAQIVELKEYVSVGEDKETRKKVSNSLKFHTTNLLFTL